jgi:hypothetical protein
MSTEKDTDSPPMHTEKLADSVEVRSEDNFNFGGELELPPPPQYSEEQEKRLWRKIDLRLMPMLTLMYLVSFLDRGVQYMY